MGEKIGVRSQGEQGQSSDSLSAVNLTWADFGENGPSPLSGAVRGETVGRVVGMVCHGHSRWGGLRGSRGLLGTCPRGCVGGPWCWGEAGLSLAEF